MSSMPTFSRLVELKDRFERLKKEAECTVLNVQRIVAKGNFLIKFQESIKDLESFLKSYPSAGTELDLLNNSLVKINCELEIAFSKVSDVCSDVCDLESSNVLADWDPLRRLNTSCAACSKEKKTVGTLTDQFTRYHVEEVNRLFNLEKESIFEMKYLHGDCPSEFWLGFYRDQDLESHLSEIKSRISSGEILPISAPLNVGQFIIGCVNKIFRGSVMVISDEKITTLDIDSAEVKLINKMYVWEIGDSLSKLPPQAILCKLNSINDDMYWCKYLGNIFKKCLMKCNLVVTIIDIIADTIPQFLVDIDAHDNSLDVNLSEWVNIHVIPVVENLQTCDVSDVAKLPAVQNLDPYVIYNKAFYDSDSYNSNDDITSDDGVNHDLERIIRTDSENVLSDSLGMNEEDASPFTDQLCPNTNDCSKESLRNNNGDSNFSFHCIKENKKGECIVKSLEDHMPRYQPQHSHSKVEDYSPHSEQTLQKTCIECSLEKGTTLDMSFLDGGDPWNFRLHYVSKEEINELKEKMADYAAHEWLTPLPSFPEAGDFAIGKCDDEYCRVRVTEVSQNDANISVIDVDSGGIKFLTLKDLWILHEEFSSPSAMAINCSLWNIIRCPFYWSVEFGNIFQAVMKASPLRVSVKDVEFALGQWKHIVQVQIYSENPFDISEWIMISFFPNANKMKRLSASGQSVYDIISKIIADVKCVKELNLCNLLPSKCIKSSEDSKLNILKHISENNKPNDPLTTRTVLSCFERACQNFKVKNSYSELNIMKPSSSIAIDFEKCLLSMNPGTHYYAYLASVVSPDEFYMHIISEENSLLDEIQKKLQNYCSTLELELKQKEDLKRLILNCCAVFYECKWYRAKILDWLDNASEDVFVFIVDFGIYAVVSFQSVQCLGKDFYKYPAFAQRCSLACVVPPNGSDVWPERSLNGFWKVLDWDFVYEIYIESYHALENTLCVFLKEETESINDILISERLADPNNINTERCHSIVCPVIDSEVTEDVSDSDDYYDFSKEQITDVISYVDNNTAGLPSIGEELSIVVTEMINIASFYGVPSTTEFEGKFCSTHAILMELNKTISRAAEKGRLKPCKQLMVGNIVVAQYRKDKIWYRGRLLSTLDDCDYVKVFFVDYGNVDNIKKQYIKEIKNDYCKIPFQAMRLFIENIEIKKLTKQHALAKAFTVISELIQNNEVKVKVVRVENEDVVVRVFRYGVNVGEKIIEEYNKHCIFV